MTDLDLFESRLEARLQAHVDGATRRFDAVAIADAAIGVARRTRRGWRGLPVWQPTARPAQVLLVALLVALLVGAGVLVGSQLLKPSPSPLIPTALDVFTPTGSLSFGRQGHVATVLADGRVLVIGGEDAEPGARPVAAEVWDPVTGAFETTGTPLELHPWLTTVLLHDGRVLVLGSDSDIAGTSLVGDVELWDPATGLFTSSAPMARSTGADEAIMLDDGRVLVNHRGGIADEIRDPATGMFTAAGPEALDAEPGGVRLIDGRYLYVGDGSARVWDPATGESTPADALIHEQESPSLTVLDDGRVLVTGGGLTTPTDSPAVHKWGPVAWAEVWDPTTTLFTDVGVMGEARAYHTASKLPDGRVLIVGGYAGGGGGLDTAELFELE